MGGPYIGFDPQGVEEWKGQLNVAHEGVIEALTKYRTIAEQNNNVAKGSHFVNINAQCNEITSKHLQEHDQLHTDYVTASDQLVAGVQQVAGN
jgi:ClpP class serine protease